MTEEKKEKEIRKIFAQNLTPPPEVIKKMADNQKKIVPKNKFFRFLKIFFGEGF